MPDIGAAILAKLKNKSKSAGIPYQQCLQLFFQEEFLHRLSKSQYADNLVLKGGLFIYTLTNFESRATVDIDFLLQSMSNDTGHTDIVINEILATPTGYNDVVIMKAKQSEKISPHRKYQGISTQIIGNINNVRVPFDIDIGVGDIIVPSAQKRMIRTQLSGYEAPEILTYSLESTISEKFDAILQRYELTGRMKDFYDIYYLSQTFDFDSHILKEAILKTLTMRGTPYEQGSFDRIIMLADDSDMQVKWRYFLRTIKNHDMPFSIVIGGIDSFLRPIWAAIVNEKDSHAVWNCAIREWR